MCDQLLHGRLGDVQLAERGQHLLDVGEEGVVRADHQGAGAGQPLPVRVQQVRHPVQADGGLAGAGRALHAEGAGDVGADDLVLLRLDGGHDVAHRADARLLDLGGQQGGGGVALGRIGEVLVLVRGQLAAGVAEAAAALDVHRGGAAGPVERLGDRRAPVDHHRVAVGVVHVAAPDVEAVPAGALAEVLADRVQVVEPAEEQRGVGEVGQGGDPGLDLLGQHDGGDPGTGHVSDVERLDVLAHRAQGGPGRGQVVPLALQGVGGGGGGHSEPFRLPRGPGAADRRSSRWIQPTGCRAVGTSPGCPRDYSGYHGSGGGRRTILAASASGFHPRRTRGLRTP